MGIRSWRSYFYCPTCGKRLHTDAVKYWYRPSRPGYSAFAVPAHHRKENA